VTIVESCPSVTIKHWNSEQLYELESIVWSLIQFVFVSCWLSHIWHLLYLFIIFKELPFLMPLAFKYKLWNFHFLTSHNLPFHVCVYLPVASQLEIHLNGYNKFQIWFLAASCFWLLTLSWLMHLLFFEQIQFFFLKYQLRWDCLVIFCLVWWGYIQERWITFLMIAVKLCWR